MLLPCSPQWDQENTCDMLHPYTMNFLSGEANTFALIINMLATATPTVVHPAGPGQAIVSHRHGPTGSLRGNRADGIVYPTAVTCFVQVPEGPLNGPMRSER